MHRTGDRILRRRRRALAGGAGLVVAVLTMALSAQAATTNYWGYNYINSGNPPSGTCSGYGSGWACTGWNYWDYSQIDRASSSGGQVGVGFIGTAGPPYYGDTAQWMVTYTGGTYTVFWADKSPTHYNRALCLYDGGNQTYVQCRALIF